MAPAARKRATHDPFTMYVLDQLSGYAGTEGRAMFGGVGVYQDGVMFGIIFKRRLYFHVSRETAGSYTARRMKAFAPSPGKVMKAYREVPLSVLEDADMLTAWARTARGVPRATSRPKARKPRAKPTVR